MKHCNFNELLNKTIIKITGLNKDSECVDFFTSDRINFRLCHEPDCCEKVSIEDINGDSSDLIGYPILLADEHIDIIDETLQYTFYRLRTVKGSVDIRWCGESNGYYSMDVSFGIVAS